MQKVNENILNLSIEQKNKLVSSTVAKNVNFNFSGCGFQFIMLLVVQYNDLRSGCMKMDGTKKCYKFYLRNFKWKLQEVM